MANYIKNTIIAQDCGMLRELLVDEDGKITFQKIKPMPKEMEGVSHCNGIDSLASYSNKEIYKELNDTLTKIYNENITQEEFVKVATNDALVSMLTKIIELRDKELSAKQVSFCKKNELPFGDDDNFTNVEPNMLKTPFEHFENYVKGFYNVQKFGASDSLDWCVKNWGITWDAIDGEILEDGSIYFVTAWNPPERIYEELVKYTPIRVSFVDCCRFEIRDYHIDKSGQLVVDYLLSENIGYEDDQEFED